MVTTLFYAINLFPAAISMDRTRLELMVWYKNTVEAKLKFLFCLRSTMLLYASETIGFVHVHSSLQ